MFFLGILHLFCLKKSWPTLRLSSPRSTRRLSWTLAPSSTSTGNSLRPRPTTCARCSSNPTTPSRSPTYASFGTSWRGAVPNFDLIRQDGVTALAQELFPVRPLTPGLKMRHGKQEVGEVFRSLLQRCSVKGNSSHASSLCVLPFAAPEGALSNRHPTAWRHWEVWNWTYQNLGAAPDLRLECGRRRVVTGRPDTKAPRAPPGGRLCRTPPQDASPGWWTSTSALIHVRRRLQCCSVGRSCKNREDFFCD